MFKYTKANIPSRRFWTEQIKRFSDLKFSKVKIFKATSNNINFNLATEEFLFEKGVIDCPVLFLWQNDMNIVIGKHQNPWKECNISKMENDGVLLARRRSGGGAVFQDMGNLVYSFFLPYTKNSRDFKLINNEILGSMFKALGINADFSGRNDITVDGLKISGNAFKVIPPTATRLGKTLHHGTILLDVNMENLQSYLNVNKLKLISKGIDSVRSRVLNLRQKYNHLSAQIVFDQMERSFVDYYDTTEVERLELGNENCRNEDSRMETEVKRIYNELSSWDWKFGVTPEFTNSLEYKFDWGLVDLSLEVRKGKIHKGKVYSDCLDPDFIDAVNIALESLLVSEGFSYDREGIGMLIRSIEKYIIGNALHVSSLLVKERCDMLHEQLAKLV